MNRAFGTLLVIVGLLLFGFGLYTMFFNKTGYEIQNAKSSDDLESSLDQVVKKSSSDSIFVPYWGIDGFFKPDSYEESYYFGITFDDTGSIENESGSQVLSEYLSLISGREEKSFVVLRFIDQDFNNKVLSDEDLQNKIIASTQDFLNLHPLAGIVLDLEMSGLSFGSTESSIESFITNFADAVHTGEKKMYVTLYGDTYYRARPYNVSHIASVVDKVIVMAYDFHKARGKPGPNFPYNAVGKYPYSFKEMVDDFLVDVEPDKLIITFGLFGYDWTEGESGLAEAYSYNKIKQDFLSGCTKDNCQIMVADESKESQIQYADESGKPHTVWFESPESVFVKRAYAQEKGIYQFSTWAYSYY